MPEDSCTAYLDVESARAPPKLRSLRAPKVKRSDGPAKSECGPLRGLAEGPQAQGLKVVRSPTR
jgi:hypothetical protein